MFLNSLWPRKLHTPEIGLGIPLTQGLAILHSVGTPFHEQFDGERFYRVDTPHYRVSVFYSADRVTSVWYDDPLGRISSHGKWRKTRLYMARYGVPRDWEMRMDMGWQQYYYNEEAHIAMIYGVYNDDIRFLSAEETSRRLNSGSPGFLP